MRYCEYCGTPQDDDALFCTNCGQRLSAIEQPLQSSEMELPAAEDTLLQESAIPTENQGLTVEGPAQTIEPQTEEPKTLLSTAEEPESTSPTTAESDTSSTAAAEEEEDDDVAKVEELPEENAKSKSRKAIILGGVLATLLVAGAAWLIFKGKGGNAGDDVSSYTFNIAPPEWDKFVVVTENDVSLYKLPDAYGPKLALWAENLIECCFELDTHYLWDDEEGLRGYSRNDFYLYKDNVLPVISEEGNWYRILLQTWDGKQVEGYIKKSSCREITPTPIDEKVLEELDNRLNRCDYLVNDGEFKNICFTSELYEEEGDAYQVFSVGELVDGVLLYPEQNQIQLYNGNSQDIKLDHFTNDGYEGYKITYGPKHIHNIDSWTMEGIFDARQLPYDMLGNICRQASMESPRYVKACYYFPEINGYSLESFTIGNAVETASNRSVNSQSFSVTGYSVDVRDYEAFLRAELNDNLYEETGVSYPTGVVDGLEIINVGDYDGNGDMEALIQEHSGGSVGDDPPYIVFYDKDSKKYRSTERFNTSWEVEVNNEDGKTVFIQRYGIREDVYVFDGESLKQTAERTADTGRVLRAWTRDALFGDAEESRVVYFDMDGDGTDEAVTLTHGTSHPYMWGQCISLDIIKWSYGATYYCYQSHVPTAATIAVLDAKTNGMHDLLNDNTFLYRWNGSQYEEWIWNGRELVKK